MNLSGLAPTSIERGATARAPLEIQSPALPSSPTSYTSVSALKPSTPGNANYGFAACRSKPPNRNRAASWPSSMPSFQHPNSEFSDFQLQLWGPSSKSRRRGLRRGVSSGPRRSSNFRTYAEQKDAESSVAASAVGDDDSSSRSTSHHSRDGKEAALEELEKESQILDVVSSVQERLLIKLEKVDEKEKKISDEEEGNGKHQKGEGSESSDEDEDEEAEDAHRKSKISAMGDEEGGTEAAVQEYSLSEDGEMSTVTVKVGGNTRKTRNQLEGALAHVSLQAEMLQKLIREFSVKQFFKDFGKKEPGLEDLRFNASMYSPKVGISNVAQWTALELTLQRNSMTRIAKDTLYLVCAFTLFGVVRILECLVAVFSTSPPSYNRLMDGLNALDPLTIASLSHALRQPVVGMLEVDPTNLEEVSSLKAKFWAELHKFYERQWKVMATLGLARLLALIVKQLPSAEWMTSRVKFLWDVTMALPIF